MIAMHFPKEGARDDHGGTKDRAKFTESSHPPSLSSTSLQHHPGYETFLPHCQHDAERQNSCNPLCVTGSGANLITSSPQTQRRKHRRRPGKRSCFHQVSASTSTNIDRAVLSKLPPKDSYSLPPQQAEKSSLQDTYSSPSKEAEKMSPLNSSSLPSKQGGKESLHTHSSALNTKHIAEVGASMDLKAQYSTSIMALNAVYSPYASSSAHSSPPSSSTMPYRVQDWPSTPSTPDKTSQTSTSHRRSQPSLNYQSWSFVPLLISDLPLDVTIRDMLTVFGEYGNVKSISLKTDTNGRLNGKAEMRMR